MSNIVPAESISAEQMKKSLKERGVMLLSKQDLAEITEGLQEARQKYGLTLRQTTDLGELMIEGQYSDTDDITRYLKRYPAESICSALLVRIHTNDDGRLVKAFRDQTTDKNTRKRLLELEDIFAVMEATGFPQDREPGPLDYEAVYYALESRAYGLNYSPEVTDLYTS